MYLARVLPKLTLLLAIFCFLLCCRASQAQQMPESIWISLGYSTLSNQKFDLKWLDSLSKRRLSKTFVGQKKIAGIIVPVFTNGSCLYTTKTPPFVEDGQNQEQQEKALKSISAWAKKNRIPLYLGFNVLNWQDSFSLTESKSLTKQPDWEEIPRPDGHKSSSESRFASPFNPAVANTLALLVGEAMKKFPDSAGAVFDLHLSRREILGYSLSARGEAIKERSIDPIELPLDGRADATLDALGEEWLMWRQQKMKSIFHLLAKSCQQAKPTARVLLSGDAGYYEYAQLNSARSCQDWGDWMANEKDVVSLIEGRWIPNYHDAKSLKQAFGLHRDFQKRTVPVLMGSSLGRYCDYKSEWETYSSQGLNSDTAVLIVRNDKDMECALDFVKAGSVEAKPLHISVGQIAPPFTLPDFQGRIWSLEEFVGEKSVALKFRGHDEEIESAGKIESETKNILVLPFYSKSNTLYQNTLTLYDTSRTTTQRFVGIKDIHIDRAGFVTNINSQNSISEKTVGNLPGIRTGGEAPSFTVSDMRGADFKLSDLRGKIVLLTFFPRSFTTGCASQLASLENSSVQLGKMGVQIVGISVDPFDLQSDFAKHLGLSFNLLPDVGRNICLLYGATKDRHGLANRLSILIDQTGTIRWIGRQVNVNTHGQDVVSKVQDLNLTNSSLALH